ncbi:MAG: hypothetical protein LBI14_11240 [Treponema sp.]|nr:hypothetical protein [Treponema sp.]
MPPLVPSRSAHADLKAVYRCCIQRNSSALEPATFIRQRRSTRRDFLFP